MKNEYLKKGANSIDPNLRQLPHVAEALKNW